jgi:hypothetical protein
MTHDLLLSLVGVSAITPANGTMFTGVQQLVEVTLGEPTVSIVPCNKTRMNRMRWRA